MSSLLRSIEKVDELSMSWHSSIISATQAHSASLALVKAADVPQGVLEPVPTRIWAAGFCQGIFHSKGGNFFSSANKPWDVEELVQPSSNCEAHSRAHICLMIS